MKQLIYIADDEPNIRELIGSFLEKEGYAVRGFASGDALLEAFAGQPADLVILDIMMPGSDGLQVCAALRRQSSVPVIMVSARDSEADRITGITLGSDDYITKPFSPIELVARVKAIFRRIYLDTGGVRINLDTGGAAPASRAADADEPAYGDLKISLKLKQASVTPEDGGGVHTLDLSPTEFALAVYLIKNCDRAVSREELLRNIWKYESDIDTRATDDVIKRLRKKLSAAGSSVSVETVWGYGFKLEKKGA